MIEINTWMNGFLKSINEAFGSRVWFVGLQVQNVTATGQQGRNVRPGGATIGGQPGTEFMASRLG